MNKATILMSLHLLLLSGAASAADPSWRGVWSGTIGKQQVMVCLDHDDSSSYYYRRHSYDISLEASDKKGPRWAEMTKGKRTGEWKFESITRDRLTGNWFASKGKRSTPIVLERVSAPANEGQLCDDEAYNGPRIDAVKINAGSPENFEGKRFRTLSAGVDTTISTVELLESGPGVAGVNQALRAELRERIGNYYECLGSDNTRAEEVAEYSVTESPVFWSSRWLALAVVADDYCGGLRINHHYWYSTWDLSSGKNVDLWTWFEGMKYEASAALNKIIVAHAKFDEECAEMLTENVTYSLHPSREGMVFSPQLYVGCQDDIVVPYDKLLPFLSPVGKREVKALMSPRR
ncbi:hypothetical protein KI811_16710 [Geobacter hydrogenophilus]|uniref:DUF3298 domain-containing protein n=1 Tax=Geobacter hydrogenophilus TaxID=40983 RepID=A0A9W6G0V1_9BACT|nr:hypothetical protein [Geobacter hydrogenophilus]MBT0895448.1 hypothetical protein [Geobacter hydrogenophilus]GLI38328.1 hypothetical protein GHYDROH2_18290 [Geobacter hydrogenophilus]